MIMIDLLERALRAARILLFLSLMALAACGPGSGGTGTGPRMALKFSGSTGGGEPVIGASPVRQLTFNLRIEDGLVDLVVDGLLTFKGEWSEPGADFVVLVPGSAVLLSGPEPAVLRMEFNGEPQASSAVTVTITSADQPRLVLLDPFTLARVVDSARTRP
jgi:hypothetical protein